jgi:hypothetical protein
MMKRENRPYRSSGAMYEGGREPVQETLQEALEEMTMSDLPPDVPDVARDLARTRTVRAAATASAATAAAAAAMTTAVFLRGPLSRAAASVARDTARVAPKILVAVGLRHPRSTLARIAPWAGVALGVGAIGSALAVWLTHGDHRSRMGEAMAGAMGEETAASSEEGAMVNGLFSAEPLGGRT